MTQCYLCQHCNMSGHEAFKKLWLARCMAEEFATFRNPTKEHDCVKYHAADNMQDRINWHNKLKV